VNARLRQTIFFRREFARYQAAARRTQHDSGIGRRHRLSRVGRPVHGAHYRQSGGSGAHVAPEEPCRWPLSLPSRVYRVLGLTRLAAAGLQDVSRATLRPLLALQLVLLVSFLVVNVAAGPFRDPTHSSRFGRYARRCRDGRAECTRADIISRAPATAVMTTDITKFMMDLGAILFRSDPDEVARAASRAKGTCPRSSVSQSAVASARYSRPPSALVVGAANRPRCARVWHWTSGPFDTAGPMTISK